MRMMNNNDNHHAYTRNNGDPIIMGHYHDDYHLMICIIHNINSTIHSFTISYSYFFSLQPSYHLSIKLHTCILSLIPFISIG
jgi:hypothetical protein